MTAQSKPANQPTEYVSIAEAAARYHYGVPAARIGHEQGARLAAILPAPRHRQPGRMNRYSARILGRMTQMGW